MVLRIWLCGFLAILVLGCDSEKTEGPQSKTGAKSPAKTIAVKSSIEPAASNLPASKNTVEIPQEVNLDGGGAIAHHPPMPQNTDIIPQEANPVARQDPSIKPKSEQTAAEKQAKDPQVADPVANQAAPIPDPNRKPDPEEPIDLETQRILDDGSPERIPQVIALLSHKNPLVREAAVRWFDYDKPLPAKAIQPMALRLSDPNAQVAHSAINHLEDLEDVSAIHAELHSALRQKDSYIQGEVARLCRQLTTKTRPPLSTLVSLLKSDYTTQNGMALEMIAEMGSQAKPAVPQILSLLEEGTFQSFKGGDGRSIKLTAAAARTLGKVGATDELLRLARSGESSEERFAVQGLVHVRPMTPQILSVILRLAKDEDNFFRDDMVEALGDISPIPQEALAVIEKGLADKEEEVRKGAVLAISRATPRPASAFPAVLKAMEDEDDEVRKAASAAIGEFRDKPELRLKALLVAVNDTGYDVSENAIKSLNEASEQSLPLILSVLENPKELPKVRLGAILTLSAFEFEIPEDQESATRNTISGLLDNRKESVDVRSVAAYVLRRVEGEHALQEEAFIAGLRSGSTGEIRQDAANLLSQYPSEESVAALIDGLQDPEHYVAYFSASSLGAIGDLSQPAIPTLIEIANKKDHGIRNAAVETMGRISTKATYAKTVPALMKLAGDEEPGMRKTSLEALERILDDVKREKTKLPQTDELVKLFIKGLSDEKNSVREHAAGALEPMAPDAVAAIPALTRGLSDEDYSVRWACVRALQEFGKAARSAEDALILAATKDEDDTVRQYAIDALGDIDGNPKKIVPVLTKALKDKDLQFWALTSLQSYAKNAEMALPELQLLLNSPEESVRGYAASILGQLGDKAKPAIPRLKAMIEKDGDGWARNDAAKALLQITPTSQTAAEIFEAVLRGNVGKDLLDEFRSDRKETLVALLTEAVNHKDGEIRAGALGELKQLKDVPGEEEIFQKALKDPEPKVRLVAALALSEIGGDRKTLAPVLVASLGQADDDNRWELRSAIRNVGGRVISGLARRAADRNEPDAVRRDALELLQSMGQDARFAAPDFRKIVGDENDPFRYQAALTWQYVSGDPTEIQSEIQPVLLAAIKSPEVDARLRIQAASNLRRISDTNRETVPTLFAVLTDPVTDANLRETISYAIGRQTLDDECRQRAINLLNDAETQKFGVVILGQQKSLPKEAVATLIAVLNNTDENSYSLTNAFVQTGEPGLRALLELAEDSSAPLTARQMALDIVRNFSDAHLKKLAIARVKKLLSSNRMKHSAAICLASWKYGTDEIVDLLVEALQEPNRDLRNQAEMALSSLHQSSEPWEAVVSKILPLLTKAEVDEIKQSLYSVLGSVGRNSKVAAKGVIDSLQHHANADFRNGVQYSVIRLGPPVGEVIAEKLATNPSKEFTLYCLDILSRSWGSLPAGVSAIRELVEHEDPEIAFHASVALAKQAKDDAAALPALLDAIHSEDKEQWQEYYQALGAIKQIGREAAPAVPRLVELIEEDRFADEALSVLGSIGEPARDAIPNVIEALKRPGHRDTAIDVLGQFGTLADSAVPDLVKFLEEEQAMDSTVDALVKIRPSGRDVLPVLVAQLEDKFLRLDALGYLGDFGSSAKGTVPKILPFVTDPDALTRAEALFTLAKIGEVSSDAFPTIKERITDKNAFVRTRAAYALGVLQMEPKQSVSALRTALKDSDLPVRQEAVGAIRAFGSKSAAAVDDLLPILADENDPLRYQAIVTLGRIGTPAKSSLPQLMALAQSGVEDHLQEEAQIAVWNIDPKAAKAANFPEPPAARAEKPPQEID